MLKIFRTECEQFGIEKTEIPLFDEMASDLENCENNWLLYEQFNVGLQEMADEEWILFRQVSVLFITVTKIIIIQELLINCLFLIRAYVHKFVLRHENKFPT